MMTPLDSLILGIVEGITEFLPVSSTGHLILASELLGITPTEFLKSYEIAIQLGAIAAVLLLYWKSFLDPKIVKRIAAAFLPTAVIGFTLYHFVKDYLLENTAVVLASLFIGGVALIVLEFFHKERPEAAKEVRDMTYLQAFLIGLAQSIAIIPGISRSGASIVGGLLVGISRVAIVEFSFLLAVPTIAAATGYDLLKNSHIFTLEDLGLLAIGFAVSFSVALLTIKFLLGFVRRHTFIPFGVYRILVALLFLFIVL